MADEKTEWWKALLKGENEIDVEKISRGRDLSQGLPAGAAEKLREKLYANNQSNKAESAIKKVKQQKEKIPQTK